MMKYALRCVGFSPRLPIWTIQDTLKLDKRQLMEEALSEQLKEKAEAEKKLQRLMRSLDHLERAKR